MEEGDGLPFDTQSLTEDYDIGFRLKKWGMKEIFVRYSVAEEQATLREKRVLTGDVTSRIICVREHFPNRFSDAIKQKSRWIVGIVFQGFQTHGWSNDAVMNYFLWRDRRGLFANVLSFVVMVVFLQLVLLMVYQWIVPQSYRFLAIFSGDWVVSTLIVVNLILLINRLFQRFIFVSQYYGVVQGVLSLPRIFWGTVINFFAVIRAIKLVVQVGDARKVAWDKTQHEFPLVMGPRKLPLGQLLVRRGLITQETLERALFERPFGTRLGVYLVQQGHISLEQLCETIAADSGLPFEYVDLRLIDRSLTGYLPQMLAYKYLVIPLAFDAKLKLLTVGSESPVSGVVVASLRRALGLKIQVTLVQGGAVIQGLRYLYLADDYAPPENFFTAAEQSLPCWQQQRDNYYVSKESIGQILINHKLISPSVIKQATLAYFSRPQLGQFGTFLIQQGYVSESTFAEALRTQAESFKEGIRHEND